MFVGQRISENELCGLVSVCLTFIPECRVFGGRVGANVQFGSCTLFTTLLKYYIVWDAFGRCDEAFS